MKVEGGAGGGGSNAVVSFSLIKNHEFREIQTSLRDSLKLNFFEVI